MTVHGRVSGEGGWHRTGLDGARRPGAHVYSEPGSSGVAVAPPAEVGACTVTLGRGDSFDDAFIWKGASVVFGDEGL